MFTSQKISKNELKNGSVLLKDLYKTIRKEISPKTRQLISYLKK